MGILGIILLIHLGVYLSFNNRFWLGLAGILSVPFLLLGFMADAYTSVRE